jgi:hypothetical protein
MNAGIAKALTARVYQMNMRLFLRVGLCGAVMHTVTTTAGVATKHIRPGRGALEYHMRHGGGHFAIAGQLGVYFPTPPGLFPWESEPDPVPSLPIGGFVIGIAGRVLISHPTGLTSHSSTHSTIPVYESEARVSQAFQRAAPTAVQLSREKVAAAQPRPTAKSSRAYPPGIAGPGRPIAGWAGPGQPGPGQPASP